MVLDRLANSHLYLPLGPRIAKAFDYVQRTDFTGLADGRHDLDGERLFALLQRYRTKPTEDGLWEAHRRYIDLQVVVGGVERMGHAPVGRLAAGSYDPARDFMPLDGLGDFVTLPAGHFVLFWPEDAHMPGLAIDAPAEVTKVVVKIEVG